MKMKNTKYKMDIACIMKRDKARHENIIEHTILF